MSPQIAGYVTGVKVQDFQEVTAGDLLVQIDDRILQSEAHAGPGNTGCEASCAEELGA